MRLRRVLLAVSVGFALLLNLPAPHTALAATITLQNGTTYECTFAGLSAAITAAQTNDTIAFDCPADTTLVFPAAITIPDRTLTIDGNNNDSPVTFDGATQDRLLHIPVNADITLKHLRLQNGSRTGDTEEDGSGGAILNEGKLSIINCTFTDNQANAGGAISNSGTLSIDQSTFSGNSAFDGGAVNNAGALSVTDSNFSSNTGFLKGGAIYSSTSSTAIISISTTTFTTNISLGVLAVGGQGGAIASEGATLQIDQSTFTDNFATVSGGALHMPSGSAEISLSTFSNNQAGNGGALTISSSGTSSIEQSTFMTNQAGTGGAIAGGNGLINISLSIFTQNHATGLGGAISVVAGTIDVEQSQFSKNWSGQAGGVVSNLGGSIKISQSSFTGNSAGTGGGVILSALGATEVDSSTFTANTAASNGSVIVDLQPTEPTTIAWSTIVQPAETTPALAAWDNAAFPLQLEGIILGGEGPHCEFIEGGTISDSYTLSNDTSCGLSGTGSIEGITDLGLGDETTLTLGATTTFDGVQHTYFPLELSSPAVETGIATCPTPDQIGTTRPLGTVCDIGAIESTFARPTIDTIDISTPRNEGQPITVSVSASDDNTDPLTFSIDCNANDAVPPVASSSTTCSYPDQGSYTLTITVSDGTLTATANPTIDVLNVAPLITSFSTPPTALTGALVILSATATDVPADDPLTYTYDCGEGTLIGTNQCQFDRGGSYTVSVLVDDGDQGTATQSHTIQVFDSATLCANRWNGTLRLSNTCTRSETTINLPLPNYADLALCVNQWNGATRVSDHCSRSEQLMTTRGQDTLHVCINQWNGTLRVSDHCTRSEYDDWL